MIGIIFIVLAKGVCLHRNPGTILLGARYDQERGVAMDGAEIVNVDETVETAASTFEKRAGGKGIYAN
jgi:hypothetical protein